MSMDKITSYSIIAVDDKTYITIQSRLKCLAQNWIYILKWQLVIAVVDL